MKSKLSSNRHFETIAYRRWLAGCSFYECGKCQQYLVVVSCLSLALTVQQLVRSHVFVILSGRDVGCAGSTLIN